MATFPQLLLCWFLLPGGTSASTSSLDEKALRSLREMFGDSVQVSSLSCFLPRQDRDSIARASRSLWEEDSVRVLVCRNGGKIVGFGFVDNVKGKTQYITYLAGIRPEGTVRDIDVLAYRESYGGEITYDSFRSQFRDKSADDRLEPGKDIKNISGATISVRAITAGVKKILATFNLLKRKLLP